MLLDKRMAEDGNDGLVVELRAERSGDSKSGRIYDLRVTARDLAGNEVTGTATCIVPHDRGKETYIRGISIVLDRLGLMRFLDI